MKKEWNTPILDELNISLTANGATPNEPCDGPWEQRPDGTFWQPGSSR